MYQLAACLVFKSCISWITQFWWLLWLCFAYCKYTTDSLSCLAALSLIKNWITPFLASLSMLRCHKWNPTISKPKIYPLLDMVTTKKSLQGTRMSYTFFINIFTINLRCGSWCTETPSESAVAHWLYQGSRQLLEMSYGHVEVYSGKLHPPHLQ